MTATKITGLSLHRIYPALCVSLVQRITEPGHWRAARDRFKEFRQATNIKCLSIPIEEPLYPLVNGDFVAPRNSDWIAAAKFKAAVDPANIADKAKLRSLKATARPKKLELFASERY